MCLSKGPFYCLLLNTNEYPQEHSASAHTLGVVGRLPSIPHNTFASIFSQFLFKFCQVDGEI